MNLVDRISVNFCRLRRSFAKFLVSFGRSLSDESVAQAKIESIAFRLARVRANFFNLDETGSFFDSESIYKLSREVSHLLSEFEDSSRAILHAEKFLEANEKMSEDLLRHLRRNTKVKGE